MRIVDPHLHQFLAAANRFIMSRSLAPELVTAGDLIEFDLDGNAVDARGRALYSERFIHAEIYKARPDVRAVVHNHAPSLIPFSVTTVPLRPMYHMVSFIGNGVPVFDIRKTFGMTDMLVSDSAKGRALAQVLGDKACVLMRAKMCSLMLLDETRQWLDLRASFGAGEAYLLKPRLSVDESLLGVVVRRKKPLQVDNVQTSARYQNVDVAQREGLVALLSVPLLFSDQTIGAINVYTGHPYSFSNEEIRLLSALAELSAIAIEKAVFRG